MNGWRDITGRENSKYKDPEVRDQAAYKELKEVWHEKTAMQKGDWGGRHGSNLKGL